MFVADGGQALGVVAVADTLKADLGAGGAGAARAWAWRW